MTIFYAATRKGFLDDTLHPVIPKDAVPISPEDHRALLNANSQGAKIVPNDQGFPIAVFPSETQQLSEAKAQAHHHLAMRARLALQHQAEGREESEIFSLLHRYAIAQRFEAGIVRPAEMAALEAERQARDQGESLATFFQALCAQSERWMTALGSIEGLKYRLSLAIENATTLKELDTLITTFPAPFSAAQKVAQPTQEPS